MTLEAFRDLLAAPLPAHPVLTAPEQADVIFLTSAQIGIPAPALAAIRIAEAGGVGREFGVLSVPAPTYAAQAAVAARSILHHTYRYVQQYGRWPVTPETGLLDHFFVDFGARWAPRGVANDPDDLNAHWVGNVVTAYHRYQSLLLAGAPAVEG